MAELDDDSNDRPNPPDEPALTESHWYAAGISLAIIGLILACFATAWILATSETKEMLVRTQIAAPFGTIFLALITFCTVAWRGMVSSRQADQQKRQNDANDDANLAKLLQEGAKLLGEKGSDPHILAGVATLDAVITDPRKKFAIQAMDLLASFVQDNYGQQALNRQTTAALQALANGEALKIYSRISGHFIREDTSTRYWLNIRGFKDITYEGGAFRAGAYDRTIERLYKTNFRKVTFARCRIKDAAHYDACQFENCNIISIDDRTITGSAFTDCNFSNGTIGLWRELPPGFDLRATGNFFYEDSIPNMELFDTKTGEMVKTDIDPSTFLIAKKRRVKMKA